MMNRALTMFLVAALSVPSAVVSGDRAELIHPEDLHSNLARVLGQAKTAGHATVLLAGSGNVALKLSVLTQSGKAEVHAHMDDVMIVQQGSATLITGGVLSARGEQSNGGIKRTEIQHGFAQKIAAGDVILIPAGVPHRFLIAPGTTCTYLVAKVKEP
jgi:mannose-6-phosphate isomerase-like protein (cupin superfamily)